MNYEFFKEFDKKISKLSKGQLQKLYDYITSYFENCDKYGLELRDGQYNMALSVYDAIESLDHLVIEAGVGIGKSYAYLIPLLYYHKITNEPFIVSTSTIALQEQLERDIHRLSEQLNIEIDVVVAKGMSNFLCLSKLARIAKNKELYSKFSFDKQDRKDYNNVLDKDWKSVCVDNCTYNKCESHSNCEFYKRREKMKSTTGIIICNHDLLIMDLSRKRGYGKSLLNNVNFIVCDEAHNLENKVRSFTTEEVHIQSIKESIRKSINILNRYNNFDFDCDTICGIADSILNIIEDNVNLKIERLRKKGIELIDCNGLELTFDDRIAELSKKLVSILHNINDAIQIHIDDDFDDVIDDLYDKIDMLEILEHHQKGNYLFWIERSGKKNYIYYAPKNINEIAYNLFFDNDNYRPILNSKTFVFTSGTLSVGKSDYSYFLKNIGGDMVTDGKLTTEYSYNSPYDYDNNAMIYCCSDIASPSLNKEKYLEQLVDKIKQLITITNGKTLVLFTSKSDMNYVYGKIQDKLDGINIYIQNDGSSQDKVKNQFKDDINSVLFSTGIFWEGIDIKGKSLSNLIIARLPFPIVDPIMEYKTSLYGKDGFKKVYLPEMLIKLKQGVGRLIRDENDKGIVCILDSRLNDKYQEVVKQSLPIKNFTSDIEDVKKLVKKYNIN